MVASRTLEPRIQNDLKHAQNAHNHPSTHIASTMLGRQNVNRATRAAPHRLTTCDVQYSRHPPPGTCNRDRSVLIQSACRSRRPLKEHARSVVGRWRTTRILTYHASVQSQEVGKQGPGKIEYTQLRTLPRIFHGVPMSHYDHIITIRHIAVNVNQLMRCSVGEVSGIGPLTPKSVHRKAQLVSQMGRRNCVSNGR